MDQVRTAEKHGGELEETTTLLEVSTGADSLDGSGTVLRSDTTKIWNDDTLLELKAAYKRFEKAFKQKGGKSLVNITTGDAFLTFIELHTFDAVCDMSIEEIETAISSMWQEFLVVNDKYEVEISLEPPEVVKKRAPILLNNYSANKPLKVAFIYDLEPTVSDWSYSHELGRNYIKEKFGDSLVVFKISNVRGEEEIIKAIEELIEEQKVEVIFTVNAQAISASLKCAIKYPDVKILNCSINTSHRYIRTYDARLYEAKFLSGMIAGALTETNHIGYLANYPIYGIIANINAFAMGAKMVNPKVKVFLKWTSKKGAENKEELYQSFYDDGIDILSDQDMITPSKASRKFGMYRLTEGGNENITMTVYNWGILYERIINIIMKGQWKSLDANSESKPINYWWGLSAGVVDIIISEKVPLETRRLVNIMRGMIIEDKLSPFSGRITNQEGTIVSDEGEELSIDEIITMDYLVENVIGDIPKMDELADDAKEIVEIKGVDTVQNDSNDISTL
jgi:basic membrane lipoprotein Med (substrate-binding protein (PBP1-ABC) superfamily)